MRAMGTFPKVQTSNLIMISSTSFPLLTQEAELLQLNEITNEAILQFIKTENI